MLKSLLIVGVGGFLGTIGRYLVTRHFQVVSSSVFPWGTFVVNIVGSFIIGVVYGISEKANVLSGEWRLFLAVGFCGGFTTFSSFANDSLMLLQGKEMLQFTAYASLSFALGLIAVFVGRSLMRLI